MYKTTAKVEGMRCGMCESHVSDIVRRNFDVKKVTASHVKNSLVIVSDEPIDESKLRLAIGADGYLVSNVSAEEYRPKGFWGLFCK